MRAEEIAPCVYRIETDGRIRIATRSEQPEPVYGERIVEGYRIWDPNRSKLAALFLKVQNALQLVGGLPRYAKVLYLGAATGTTVSHVSDIFKGGLVYAVEFSPRAMRDLLYLAESRRNIIPILADAARPESYSSLLEPVDLLYQDIAQRNQADIANRNATRYLKPGGLMILMIKAMSIDSSADAGEVCRREITRLEGMEICEVADLLPYHQDHMTVVARRAK